MKAGDQLKMFFIFMCLWYVTDGQECGTNPLIPFAAIAQDTGKTTEYVLQVLKQVDPAQYEVLSQNFRAYASCVGLVDTGYFKRSLTEKSETSQDQLQRRGERGRELPGALQAAVGSSNTQRMLTGKRSVAAAAAGGGGDADGAAQGKSL